MNVIRERLRTTTWGPCIMSVYPVITAHHTLSLCSRNGHIHMTLLFKQPNNRLVAVGSSGKLYQLTRKYIWNHNYEQYKS